jgi:hypothetical protein
MSETARGLAVNIESSKQYAHEVTAIMAQIDRSAAMLRAICDG